MRKVSRVPLLSRLARRRAARRLTVEALLAAEQRGYDRAMAEKRHLVLVTS
jgi:hypothetical protein